MMMYNASIPLTIPITKIKTNIITNIEISINNVVLSKCANITVILKDEIGEVIEIKHLIIEGDDYLNWGSDDNYIIDYVVSKI
jgi:hypothetical protein